MKSVEVEKEKLEEGKFKISFFTKMTIKVVKKKNN